MDFGEKIRVFAENNFGTLTKLAEMLDMDLPSLHRYITGKVKPGKDFFTKLVNLGCDIKWLLSEETEGGNLVKEPGAAYGEEESDREKIRRLEAEVKELRKKLEMIQKITGEGVRD